MLFLEVEWRKIEKAIAQARARDRISVNLLFGVEPMTYCDVLQRIKVLTYSSPNELNK